MSVRRSPADSSHISRMRTRVCFRAADFPRETNSCNSSRSASERTTRYLFSISKTSLFESPKTADDRLRPKIHQCKAVATLEASWPKLDQQDQR